MSEQPRFSEANEPEDRVADEEATKMGWGCRGQGGERVFEADHKNTFIPPAPCRRLGGAKFCKNLAAPNPKKSCAPAAAYPEFIPGLLFQSCLLFITARSGLSCAARAATFFRIFLDFFYCVPMVGLLRGTPEDRG